MATEVTFTARDNNLIIAFLASVDVASADWVKVARMTGLAHAKSARDSFASVRKKVNAFAAKYETGDANAEDELAPEATAAEQKGARKRKTDEEEDTPAAGQKKNKKKKPAAAAKATKAKAKKTRGKKAKTEEDDAEENITVKAPTVDYEDHSSD